MAKRIVTRSLFIPRSKPFPRRYFLSAITDPQQNGERVVQICRAHTVVHM